MPIGQPSGNVDQAVGYMYMHTYIEFKGEVRAGNVYLRIINIESHRAG